MFLMTHQVKGQVASWISLGSLGSWREGGGVVSGQAQLVGPLPGQGRYSRMMVAAVHFETGTGNSIGGAVMLMGCGQGGGYW